MRGRLGVLLCVVAVTGAASLAQAQSSETDNDRMAREHFELGKALYSAGQYNQAIGEFEISYRLSKRPPLLYNIYLAARNAGQRRTAADALRRYLRLSAKITNRSALELQLRALDESLRNFPPDAPMYDQHGERISIKQSQTSMPEPHSPPLLGVTITGLGAAMLIGGAVTGLMAISQDVKLQDRCPDNVCLPGLENDINRLDTLNTLTDVLLLGGAGVLALGIGLWLWLDTDETESAPMTPIASCTWDGCVAQARMHF